MVVTRCRALGFVALVFVASVVSVETPVRAGPAPDPSCRSLWPGLGADTPGGACRLVDEYALDPSVAHLYVQEDVARDRVPDDELRELTADAVQRSFLEYTLVGVMPGQVDIVIVPSIPDADADAGPDSSGTCVVKVRAAALRPARYYQQLLAHELFHCFQFKQVGSDVFFAADRAGGWWYEGTAEYFSNVVYPAHDFEHENLGRLRRLEPGQSIFELSYENFAFFQHFANRQGNAAVVEFMTTMPPGGGRAAQMAAASAWPGMDELFHDFARAFVSDGIIDSSGEAIRIRADHQTLGRHTINHPGEIFRIPDLGEFEIHRILMDFPERREFDLEQDFSAGIRTGAQEGGPLSLWEELPDPIETCDAPQKWRLLLTTTAVGAEEPAALKVVDITSAEGEDSSTTCCISDAESTRETRAERRQVRVVVCGSAFSAVFRGGVCYLEGGFLNVAAGYDVFDSTIEATGPFPRGYAFILGTAVPGSESPGFPNVSISDGDALTPYGSNASITKSDDLLTGTFASDDIYGSWRCPRLTPIEEAEG